MKFVLTLMLFAGIAFGANKPSNVKAAGIVQEIQRADYRGDRAALKSLHSDLALYKGDAKIGARVLYWRGFALWRRALNGFNDGVAQQEIEQDLRGGIAEFEDAFRKDPKLVDAEIAEASCLMNLLYIHLHEPGAVQEYSSKFKPLIKHAEMVDPENPRLLWIMGAARWYMPAAQGGGPGIAIETYGRGLESVHHRSGKRYGPLDPSWGEPELLMNLAWATLHLPNPDLKASEEYATAALRLVPDWHYVRDILLPQIRQAQAKAATSR